MKAAGEGGHLKNAARDLTRRLLEPNQAWPVMYVAALPFQDEPVDIHFHLPHELVEALDDGKWKLQGHFATWYHQLLDQLELVGQDVVPLTLWGDAVPYTKSSSLFQVWGCVYIYIYIYIHSMYTYMYTCRYHHCIPGGGPSVSEPFIS